MASTALLGFLKGASGSALDSMELREKEAAERRKLELAAKINHEYFQKTELFKEGLPSNVQRRKIEANKELRDQETHGINLESGRLGLDKTRQDMELDLRQDSRADRLTNAQIDNYGASAAASRARAAGGGGLDSAGFAGSATVGMALANSFDKTLKSLEENFGVPRLVAEQTAANVVASVRAENPEASPDQLMELSLQRYQKALDRLKQGYKPVLDSNGKPRTHSETELPLMQWAIENVPGAIDHFNRRTGRQ